MSRFRFRSAAGRRPRWTVLLPVTLLVLAAAVTAGAAVREANTVEVVSFYPEGAPDYNNLQAINRSFEATHRRSSRRRRPSAAARTHRTSSRAGARATRPR